MRNSLLVVVLCSLGACATYDPNADNNAYRENQISTGSNIPRKGTATSYDKDSITDVLSRSSGGAPTRGAGGG